MGYVFALYEKPARQNVLQPDIYDKLYICLFGMTDRQTDILLTEIKVITDLFVIVIREIYVHVYTRMLVC